jgi:hypothetical protein
MAGPFAASTLIKNTEFYLGGIDSYEQAKAIHKASKRDLARYMRADTVLFVIGNYDDPQKDRVEAVRDQLSELRSGDEAFILEDIDPEINAWENFYVKFRVLLEGSDYVIGVFEDNDGGHELELGEADLSTTYILKRNYSHASIDEDVEYEKYDAMLGTLFEMMDERGHLLSWTSEDELESAIEEITTTLQEG